MCIICMISAFILKNKAFSSVQRTIIFVFLVKYHKRCNSFFGKTIKNICLLYMPSVYPRGVMVKVMDCRIVASEFVLQSRSDVHFRTNTLGKGMNPLILPAMG